MAHWFEVNENKTVKECDESIKRVKDFIKQTSELDVVQDVNEWDWRARFPDLETACNLLLKQLELQREILIWFFQSKYRDLINKRDQLVKQTKEE